MQRVARANMQSGRFTCNECSGDWPSEPSFLYLMRFKLPEREAMVKFGFSRDPESRLSYQLQRTPDRSSQLERVVPMPTGRDTS